MLIAIVLPPLLLLLNAPADDLTKLIVAVSGGCGIGALVGAWGVVQFGRKVWRSEFRDFTGTEEFKEAIAECAAEGIRLAIKEHDELKYPHGTWRHDVLVEWQTAIEGRLWKLERRQP